MQEMRFDVVHLRVGLKERIIASRRSALVWPTGQSESNLAKPEVHDAHRLMPVLRGLRVESMQSRRPYLTHRSHGLKVSTETTLCLSPERSTDLVFEHFLQAF